MRPAILVLAFVLVLAGCTHFPGAPPSSYTSSYSLDTGDKVRVIIYSDQTLSQEYGIGDDGMLDIPLVGQVPARGKTTQMLTEEVLVRLKQGIYKDPGLSIEVSEYRPFYVMGEVAKPGAYPFTKGMSVLSAVSLAGGYTIRADKTFMSVVRKTAGDRVEYQASPLTDIAPGDVLVVHEQFF